VDFPYLRQALRIERRTSRLDGTLLRQEIAFGITSLPPTKASPERLLTLNRGHWGIGASKTRRGPQPRSVLREGSSCARLPSPTNAPVRRPVH